jgi:hypothetical protein
MVNMLPLPADMAGCAMGPFPSNDAIWVDFGKAFAGPYEHHKKRAAKLIAYGRPSSAELRAWAYPETIPREIKATQRPRVRRRSLH